MIKWGQTRGREGRRNGTPKVQQNPLNQVNPHNRKAKTQTDPQRYIEKVRRWKKENGYSLISKIEW